MKHDLLNGIFSFSTGNELTPGVKYDFKFKDYAPWVFRHLREKFHVDAADYMVSESGCFGLLQAVNSFLTGYRSHPLRVDVVDQQIHLVRIDFSRKKWQLLLLLKGLSLHYQNHPSH